MSIEREQMIVRYIKDQLGNMDFDDMEFHVRRSLETEAKAMTNDELREQLGED